MNLVATVISVAFALVVVNSAVSAAQGEGTLQTNLMVREAEFVFQGVVRNIEYRLSDDNGGKFQRLPHTFVTYEIERVFKGHINGDKVTLRFLGGRGRGPSFLMASGFPLFDMGDRDVLLVRKNTEYACPLVNCSRGRFRIIQGMVFSDEGQAVELSQTGSITLGTYFDLPEVRTHKVSETILEFRSELPAGEGRQAFVAPIPGAHLDAPGLAQHLESVVREVHTPSELAALPLFRTADINAPFVAFSPKAAEPPN